MAERFGSLDPCPCCPMPGAAFTRFGSFKHVWFICRGCGSMYRKNKTSYPADVLSRLLSGPGLRGKIGRRLLPSFTLRSDAQEQGYANYGAYFDWVLSESTKASGFIEVKRQAYFKEPAQVLDAFQSCGISLRDRSVLDVSGGPGTFAYLMRNKVRRIAISEYSRQSAEAVADRLAGVRAFQADLNSPWTDEEVFDVVLYRSCIVFCRDFPRHVSEIRSRIAEGGYVYIYSALPTLGNALRWQYEDYTSNVLYSRDAVTRTLTANGFEILKTGTTDEYRHYLRWFGLRDSIFHLWGAWWWLVPGGPGDFGARAFWVVARKRA